MGTVTRPSVVAAVARRKDWRRCASATGAARLRKPGGRALPVHERLVLALDAGGEPVVVGEHRLEAAQAFGRVLRDLGREGDRLLLSLGCGRRAVQEAEALGLLHPDDAAGEDELLGPRQAD